MLQLEKIRDLTLRISTAPGRPRHVSAASGLVAVKSHLYVVADDEYHLGVFPVHGSAPGELSRIVDGDLPAGTEERKRLKPDLEALVWLPPFRAYPEGALFALGSGSKRNRRQGVLLPLDEEGAIAGEPRWIDLSSLLAAIKQDVRDLNIEGAVVVGDRLVLLQRDNKGRGGVNALVSLPLTRFLASLATGDCIGAMPFDLLPCELGAIDDIPLGFTDGAALPDGRIVFTAVAEDTDNPYLDGACAGAAVGVVAADGRLIRLEQTTPAAKVEGVSVRVDNDGTHLLMVTDADDERVPAALYAATISHE